MKTKIVGYLIVLVAVVNFVIDVLNGGGINFAQHFDTISAALAGAGLVFLRSAVQKLEPPK